MEALRVKDEVMRDATIIAVEVTPVEEPKKITIEDIAWSMYQRGIKVKWRTEPLKREDFPQYEDYKMWMDSAKQYIKTTPLNQLLMDNVGEDVKFESSLMVKLSKGKYPVIKVPANGHRDWMEGARTLCFVYSKHHGNFILEGYRGEVEEYLKKNYTKYFCYFSMWSQGRSRGYWRFWKERDVTISEPSKHRKTWKWTITSREPRYSYRQEFKIKHKIELKRLPKRWIPEFDKL
jgi:hypothetical protein